jgi:hypothetical protein
MFIILKVLCSTKLLVKKKIDAKFCLLIALIPDLFHRFLQNHFLISHQFFQIFKVFPERQSPNVSDLVTGIGFSADEFLLDHQEIIFFKRGQMTRQIAVCRIEQFFQ